MRSHRGMGSPRRGIDPRRAAIEPLEDRLVLAVDLSSAAANDRVVLTLAEDETHYDVAIGPAASGLDGSRRVVDLSRVGAGDQRYSLHDATSAPLFRVDTNESYTFTASGGPDVGELQEGHFGYRSYDADRLLIEPLHVQKYGFATDTTLVADLSPGDASFLIANASGWSDELTNPAETRALAWYGYANTDGHLYDDFTYTRNVAIGGDGGLWSPDTIWFDASVGAYRVPLSEPWGGPSIAAGTAVRNAAGGPSPSLPFPESTINAAERWARFDVEIAGEWLDGQRDEFAFHPGTEFVEPFSNVSASIWTEVVFGPTGDADTPAGTVAAAVDRSFSVELDVLEKGVLREFTPYLPGDLNGDGAVNAVDYVGLRERGADLESWDANFGGDPPPSDALSPVLADANGDGVVDAADYASLREAGADLDAWRATVGATPSLSIDDASASFGSATIVAGPSGPLIRYDSPQWFIGADVVEYTLRDAGTGETFSGRVAVEVLGENFESDPQLTSEIASQAASPGGNTAPAFLGDSRARTYTTATGIPVVIDALSDSLLQSLNDGEDDTLVIRSVAGPANGALSLQPDGTFTYTPHEGFVGVDTFRYEAFDGVEVAETIALVRVYESADELSEARLQQVAYAMLNHDTVFNRFPVDDNEDYFDENGDPYLSWRVHLLRFLDFGYRDLYEAFNLDEPWNSPNNIALLDQMPEVYLSPGDSSDSVTTRLQTFYGNGAPFGSNPAGTDQDGPRFFEFRDGPQNTILVAESGVDAAVPWTKPDDLPFNPSDPLAALGAFASNEINLAMADGSVISVSATIDPSDFAALVTIDNDELVDAATLARERRESLGPAGALQPFEEDIRLANVMKQIALAVNNYADSRRGSLPSDTLLPPSGDTTQDERGLSWRVRLLPFMGYTDLYDRFNHDEAWDSPTNLALLGEMPDLYRSAGDPSDSTTTRIVRPKGDDTAFRNFPGRQDIVTLSSILDGTSKTIFAIEAGADQSVPWTKPGDPEFDAADPLATIGELNQDVLYAAFVDASVRRLPSDLAADDFAALVTRNGGEVIDVTEIEAQRSPERFRFKANFQRTSELKELVLALHNYLDTRREELPANSFDSQGQPLLSWRISLLPFLEEQELFEQFRRNEPWDSPHNLSLLPLMPDIFRSSGDPVDSVTTSIVTFTGRGETPFPSSTDASFSGVQLREITDGTSHTLAFVDAGPAAAVPWTKPVDRPIPGNNPLGALDDLGEQFTAAYLDGSARTLSGAISPSELRALITRNGGEDTSNPPDINVQPGFFVLESHGDTKTHEFGVDIFTVVLDLAPTADVVIDVASSDIGLATIDQSRLTFTPDNWDRPQRVAFRAVDNQTVNPDRAVDVMLSVVAGLSASEYGGIASQTIMATIVDDEPRPPALMGDYNGDGVVNALDYTRFREKLGAANLEPYTGADGDGSGGVTPADRVVWAAAYGAPDATNAEALSLSGSAQADSPLRLLTVDAAFGSRLGEYETPVVLGVPPAQSLEDELLLITTESAPRNTEEAIEWAFAEQGEELDGDSDRGVRLAVGN